MIFGMDLGLFIAELGIVVTAVSAAVGIWIERDREKPLRLPIVLTIFVVCASSGEMYETVQDEAAQQELEESLATVLEQLDEVATQSEVEVPELNDLLKSEIMVNGRANPRVLKEMARRIAAKGGDPFAMLADYLPEAELQAMRRAGSFDEALKLLEGADAAAKSATRPKLTFGSGAPYTRSKPDAADAGVDDAGALAGQSDDAGVAGVEQDDAGVDAGVAQDDAGVPQVDAGTGASSDGLTERAALQLQITEARRKLAEAKTPIEKRDRSRELFALLGALDKLERATKSNPPAGPTPAPSTSTNSPPKKPEIEIEEDEQP